jgi:hypothetical protein
LTRSAENGHLEVVRLLLDSKADANSAGQVPIMPNTSICALSLYPGSEFQDSGFYLVPGARVILK